MIRKVYFLAVIWSITSFMLVGPAALAASTVGTNLSTTGTFTTTNSSATAVRFQNTGGTNIFVIDTSNTAAGVNAGSAIDTTFEVGGTASISGIITLGGTGTTGGQIRPSLNSTTAVRFQNAAGTTNVLTIDTTNTQVGVNAGTVDTTFEVGGTASISGIITLGGTGSTGGQFRPGLNGTTAFRFQNAAGSASILTIDTTNSRVGIGTTPVTTFEVQGTSSASYFLTGNTIEVGGYASVAYNRFGTAATTHSLSASNDVLINGILETDGKTFLDGTASIAGDFEVVGRASASSGFVTGSFVVGNNVASSTTAYDAEFGGSKTGTVSLLFGGGNSSSVGTCIQMKNTVGTWVYLRVFGTTLTVNTTKCHP